MTVEPPVRPSRGAASPWRPLLVGVAAAAATVVLWLLVLPRDWSVVPTGAPDSFASPVTGAQTAAVSALLGLLALLVGALGHPWVPAVAIGVPVLVLYTLQAATARTIGANLWVVGLAFLAAVSVPGLIGLGWLGRLLRRLALRR